MYRVAFKEKYKRLKETFNRFRDESSDRIGDVEQEKMMIEMELNEMQLRTRTANTTNRNKMRQLDEELQREQDKTERLTLEVQQLSYDNEELMARNADLEEGESMQVSSLLIDFYLSARTNMLAMVSLWSCTKAILMISMLHFLHVLHSQRARIRDSQRRVSGRRSLRSCKRN